MSFFRGAQVDTSLRQDRAASVRSHGTWVTEDGRHPRDELGAVAATCGGSSFSPVMLPACHKQRLRAVSSGQSRPVNSVVGLAKLSLTWSGEKAETAWHARGQAHDRLGRGRASVGTRPRQVH
jgi:hypothetical protein